MAVPSLQSYPGKSHPPCEVVILSRGRQAECTATAALLEEHGLAPMVFVASEEKPFYHSAQSRPPPYDNWSLAWTLSQCLERHVVAAERHVFQQSDTW